MRVPRTIHYLCLMPMTREEIARRLEEADRVRAMLRRTTREWRALGNHVLFRRKVRAGGSDGSDDRGARGRGSGRADR